ncbi:Osmotin, thaumatin-like protein [Aulographum hederae CBS 113979]|uniref:Osmotin, thaumatin-like protein n=1 Tax=Aulographum hederae CBS 113979 TaxID=1176131 RepID=A0A6G1H023_9PEZI|nr:Osmotin, thaumatin-like protein [Aulographum hederae CBS 113979]
MKKIAPRQDDGGGGDCTPLVVTNNCGETIYPGIVIQSGDGPPSLGFELQPGDTNEQCVSKDWQGRIWGRTNCSFNDDGTGPNGGGGGRACGTGDCGGIVECKATGEVPVTLAEFTLNAGDGQTYYDISLVDGYNLPMAIVKRDVHNASLDDIPPNLTNPSCVATAGELASQDYDPYSSGDFLGTNSSFPLPFDSNVSDSQVASWCPWALQVTVPSEPEGGVYTYPDTNVERPIFDPCYSACARYNSDQDCCNGRYNSPTACQPSEYSKAAKAVCPDAYSYAFDDTTSTFIIPAGAGFEVIFCPGGRSTTILSSEADQLQELQDTGSVSGMVVYAPAQERIPDGMNWMRHLRLGY